MLTIRFPRITCIPFPFAAGQRLQRNRALAREAAQRLPAGLLSGNEIEDCLDVQCRDLSVRSFGNAVILAQDLDTEIWTRG